MYIENGQGGRFYVKCFLKIKMDKHNLRNSTFWKNIFWIQKLQFWVFKMSSCFSDSGYHIAYKLYIMWKYVIYVLLIFSQGINCEIK